MRTLYLALMGSLFGVSILAACGGSSTAGSSPSSDSGVEIDASTSGSDGGDTPDTGSPGGDDGGADGGDGGDAGKVLPAGLLDPIAYLSRADNPFNGVRLPSYAHFEDWETGAIATPGVTAGAGYAVVSGGNTLTDSIDGDDGVVDGKCEKTGGCASAFGNGTIEFTFDAAMLGNLPTHVGIAWTDGATGCDAVFEAYDATDTIIGSKTATAVGDASNSGTVAEDRYFGVVALGGVKRIVVMSSSGGVEVDHLFYGR